MGEPAVIIDAHVHVFPSEVLHDRTAISMHEPAFRTLYEDPGAELIQAEPLVRAMDQDGVDVSVICGFPWRDVGIAKLHNDYMLEAAKIHAGRLVPLASVDPLRPHARAEAERSLSAGAAGLGEIAVYDADLGRPDVMVGLVPLARLCAEADRPLLLHTNEPVGHRYPGKSPMSLHGLYELIRASPQTRFQLAHLGGGIFFYELLKKEVSQVLAKCVYDTAAAPFLYRPDLYLLFVRLAGENRLLYGSDFPLLRLSRYLQDMEDSGLEEGARKKILGENARRFWRTGG